MKKTQALTAQKLSSTLGTHEPPGEHRRLRPRDLEALQRLRDLGPLTIPQAYDCGHADSETTGHGMNRQVASSCAVFCGWDSATDDGLWTITERGRRTLTRIES